jgi:hypothetical protein
MKQIAKTGTKIEFVVGVNVLGEPIIHTIWL